MSRNVLLIDYQFCTGCHSCEVACRNEHEIPHGKWGIKLAEDGPWQLPDGRWHWDYVPIPTEICDLCAQRVERGDEPSCVQHCQAKVMRYGTLEEMAKLASDSPDRMVIFAPLS